MVGFGSALRLSRRKGWEEAYVDYESLKLLLTQIEAVYEDSITNAAAAAAGSGYGDGYGYGYGGVGGTAGFGYGYGFSAEDYDEIGSNSSSRKTAATNSSTNRTNSRRNRRRRGNKNRGGKRKNNKRKKKLGDFRDELFVESDSSNAFVSLSDEEEDMSDEEFGDMNMNMNANYYDYQEQQQHHQRSPHRHQDPSHIEDDTAHSNDEYYHQDNNSQSQLVHPQQQQQQQQMQNHPELNDSERSSQRLNDYAAGMRDNAFPSDADLNFPYSVPRYGISDPSVYGRGGSGLGTAGGREGGQEYQQFRREHHFHPVQQHQKIPQSFDDERHPILPRGTMNTRPFAVDSFFQQQQQQKGNYSQQLQQQRQKQQQLEKEHQQKQAQHRGRSDSQGEWFSLSRPGRQNSNGSFGRLLNNAVNVPQSHSYQNLQNPTNSRRNSVVQEHVRIRTTTRRRKRRKKRIVNVPTHIRIAHTKARAITERFLGLLRAEIDKICLFTHSRMGELTDTVGSLRFPFDQTDYDCREENHHDRDHPFGIHPSASSSSDEEQYLSSSSNEKSRDHHHHHDESFMKPPLFPRRRNDGPIGLTNCSREEMMSDEDETYMNSSAWRQIKIATSLRLTKPTFQRSDYVLGEDFLLLSAMDEADAYTTTGVEFLHLLKFICINAVAVRKLCRKHDRLLASRMLGGYYKRLRMNKLDNDAIGGFRSRRDNTRSSLKRQQHILERGQQKLTGVYDSIVLSLANNSVAEDLTESLYLALSEYEVSRRRADALSGFKDSTKVNQPSDDVAEVGEEVTCYHFRRSKNAISSPESHDISEDQDDKKEKSDDALSTSSSVSLTRLRFAMASVISLREATLEKPEPFNQFFSRSMLAIDGSHFVGELQGIQGYSRDALDILLQYNPDFTLLHDPHVLKKSLLIENDGCLLSYRLRNAFDDFSDDEDESDESDESVNGISVRSHIPTISRNSVSNHCALRLLNASAIALFTMNYYIIVPSAASFCSKLGGEYMHSVILISAPNVACLISSFFQAFNTIPKLKKTPEKVFHRHLALSALFPLLGNVLYTVGYDRRSVLIAFFGRFIIGLRSSDVINKHIAVTQARTKNEITEVALLRKIHLCSVFVGLLTGSLLDIKGRQIEIHNHLFFVNFETLPSYIMFFAWTLQLLVLVLSPFPRSTEKKRWSTVEPYIDLTTGTPSTSDNEDGPNTSKKRHTRSLSDQRNLEYYLRLQRNVSEASQYDSKPGATNNRGQTRAKQHHNRTMKVILNRTVTLVFHNIALPITMALHIFSSMTIEIIISSCVIMTHRYFKWSGSEAGLFLALLVALYIPLNLIASLWSRRKGERRILKKSLLLMLVGSMIGINYKSLYDFLVAPDDVFRTNAEKKRQYDSMAGVFQYCIASSIMLAGAVLIEGASLSLISKVSPQKLNTSAINCSALVPFFGCFGKVLGTTILIIVGFSHRLIYADMVNSIYFFVIIALLLCYFTVKKHYFFLYGSQ